MSETIGIVQLGPTVHYSVERLRNRVAQKFPDYQVTELATLDTPAMAFDSSRKQYHSTRILASLEEHFHATGAERVLGVIALDLYVPGMNFVFGEARCPGRVGVISTYRLRTGTSNNSDLLPSRVLKEAVHEIGHMLGLRHCPKPSCVMYFSEHLADTDRKKDRFCSECASKMKWLEVDVPFRIMNT